MKRRILNLVCLIIILAGGVLILTGCSNTKNGNSNKESNNTNNITNNMINNALADMEQKTSENNSIQSNDKSNNIELDARYTYSSDTVGIQIDLYSNNKVVYEYIPRNGNLLEHYGTFSIDGNKLTIKLTEIDSIGREEEWKEPIVYTIVSNKEFKDKDNNNYTYRVSLEKK